MGALTSSDNGYARAAGDLGELLLPGRAPKHRNAHCYNLLWGLRFRQKQGRGSAQGLPPEECEEGGGGGDGQDREDEEHRDGREGVAGCERAGDGRVLVHREHVPSLAAAAGLGPHRRGRCAAVWCPA
jgi:hypothetical protein